MDAPDTFPSVNQLLPIYPSYDPGDGSLIRVEDVDITGVDRTRAADGDTFHPEIERAVQADRDDPGWEASGFSMHPIVGILHRTSQSARAASFGVDLLPSRDGVDLGADGTVPRAIDLPSSPRPGSITRSRRSRADELVAEGRTVTAARPAPATGLRAGKMGARSWAGRP